MKRFVVGFAIFALLAGCTTPYVVSYDSGKPGAAARSTSADYAYINMLGGP